MEGSMNKYVEKIDRLRYGKGLTFYALAKLSGVAESTINKWVNEDVVPRIDALQKICKALGMTLADFFAENNTVELTADKKELFNNWLLLSQEEKTAIIAHIKSYTSKRA
jgi:transcriptional regulator with XRE-family HTH domain